MNKSARLSAAILLGLLYSSVALALDCQSTGSGNWGVNGTWSCGRVPTNADTATVRTGHTVTLDVHTNNLQALTVQTGGAIVSGGNNRRIELNGNLALNGTITLDNEIRLNANSVWSGTATGTALTATGIDFNWNNLTFANSTVAYTIALSGGTPLLEVGALNNNGANKLVTFAMTGAAQSWEVYNTKYPQLRLSGSGTKTYVASGIEVLGDLTIDSGVTFTASNATSNNYIGGDLTRNGTFTVPTGSGTWNFNGTTAQTITGGMTFYNMNVSNSAGVVLSNGNLTVGNGSSGTLNLSGGIITTGTNKVIMPTKCTSGNISGNYWVNGNLQFYFANHSGTCTYRIGDATVYAPVTLAIPYFGGVENLGGLTLTASTRSGDHPQIATSGLNANRSVNRWWQLGDPDDTLGCVPFGSDQYNPGSYTATFQFAASDRDGGTTPGNFKVGRYFGGWATPSSSSTSATTTTISVSAPANGLSPFGSFAIGEVSGTPSGSGPANNCSPTPDNQPLADWRMDEGAWTGAANEVIDSSGNGYHGRAAYANGSGPTATTDSGTPAYTSGSQSTCRYGAFDRNTSPVRAYTYVALSNFPTLPARFTFAGWIRSSDAGASGQRILVNDDNQNGWGFSLGDGGTGSLRIFNRNLTNSGAVTGNGSNPSCGVFCIDTNNAVPTNTWRYVALTVNTTTRDVELYVFNTSGTRIAKATGKYAGTWTNGTGLVAIGGETAASSEGQGLDYHFRGNIDEMQVFGDVLTESSLVTNLQRTRSCAVLDHVEFVHDGAALTCSPEPVTILGCSGSASCNGAPASQVGGSFTITPNTIAGATWCTDVQCSSTISGAISATTGSVIYLRKAAQGSVRIGGTVGSSVSNATIQCRNTSNATFNATTACDLDYASSGLLVSIANHASCTAQTVTLQAVKANDTATRCDPAYVNVNRNLQMSLSYLNPASGTRSASFDYVTSAGGATSSVSAMGTSNVTLSNLYWNATGTATLNNFRYPDVGQVQLNPQTVGTTPVLSAIGGNVFIAAPASFAFSSVSTGPIKAGDPFNATVTAMNACTTPAATPNFGQETAPESVSLHLNARVAPSGAGDCADNAKPCDGTVTGSVTLPWSGGAANSTNLRYSEVGQITLQARLASGAYLGSTLTATGTSATVGNFTPAYFDTAVTLGCSAFTYSGQPFTATVTARRRDGGVTRNFANLSGCTVCAKDVTLSNAGVTTGFTNNTVLQSAFVAGVGSRSTVQYSFANRQTAPTNITLRAIDSTDSTITSASGTEASMPVRSGRARLLNANGSELLDLPVPFTVEYWDGANGWQRNTADACTGLNLANAVSLALSGGPAASTCVRDSGNPGESGAGCVAATPAGLAARRYQDATIAGFQGNFNLWLQAPGAGNTGSVLVTSTVPAWLQFTWTSAVASSPVARATFGVIRSGPIIYRREAY